MARLLRTLIIWVCATASQVWTLEYKSSWYGPPMGNNIPRVIQVQKSLTECLNACALRPWCKVVGYHRYGLCAIFFGNISSAVEQCNNGDCEQQDKSIMYVEREDLTTEDKRKCDDTCPYDSTQPLKKCDFTSATAEKCPIDVCPPFTKQTNGKVLGNTYEDGHKRRLQCNHGYVPIDPNNVTSQCQNGRWTNITTCVQNCPQFITPKNATVEGESITVGSTRTLNCDNDYKPVNASKITSVCDNGMWSSITRCVPDNWEYNAFEFNQSLYLFTETADTFASAVMFCKKGDGHVITIDDEEEQQWVKRTTPLVNYLDKFWLGITETNVTDKAMRMHDGATVSYYKWASGQPDKGDEKCVIADKGEQWAWRDRKCTDNFFVVCELPN